MRKFQTKFKYKDESFGAHWDIRFTEHSGHVPVCVCVCLVGGWGGPELGLAFVFGSSGKQRLAQPLKPPPGNTK